MNQVIGTETCITCDNKAQIGDLCNMCWQDLEVNDEDGLQENAQ